MPPNLLSATAINATAAGMANIIPRTPLNDTPITSNDVTINPLAAEKTIPNVFIIPLKTSNPPVAAIALVPMPLTELSQSVNF